MAHSSSRPIITLLIPGFPRVTVLSPLLRLHTQYEHDNRRIDAYLVHSLLPRNILSIAFLPTQSHPIQSRSFCLSVWLIPLTLSSSFLTHVSNPTIQPNPTCFPERILITVSGCNPVTAGLRHVPHSRILCIVNHPLYACSLNYLACLQCCLLLLHSTVAPLPISCVPRADLESRSISPVETSPAYRGHDLAKRQSSQGFRITESWKDLDHLDVRFHLHSFTQSHARERPTALYHTGGTP